MPQYAADAIPLRRQAPRQMVSGAAQVDALLTRLSSLEEVVSAHELSEDQLEEVNAALMVRLHEFTQTNDANVELAEDEFSRLKAALEKEREARRDAEEAAATAAQEVAIARTQQALNLPA